METVMMTSRVALKEWAIVVEALAEGQQVLLVRKGGIRDPKGAFQLEHREFLLYPTFEHQSEDVVRTVRSEFRERFASVCAAPKEGDTVSLQVYAGVAGCTEIRDPKELHGLERYHIWTPQFFEDRMRYRPQAPTLLVVVRAYRLPQPIPHPMRPEYAGCKSWVPLLDAIPIEGAQPVMDNQRFRAALQEISGKM